MNRIEAKFRKLKRQNKKAFIAFITVGYPNLNITKKLILEFDRIGVDILELGVPFSDPLADGPIIQESSLVALERKVNLFDTLDLVKKVRKFVNIPIALMTYYNPIFCLGDEVFIRGARKSGVDGVIIPDLPPEEGKAFIKLADRYKLDVICFIAPTTSVERIKYISRVTKGFIYYVSLTGVTGARKNLPNELINNLKLVKRYTHKPLCVGFGVSSSKQVKQICKIADGVIVGSAIIQQIKNSIGKPDLVKEVSKFVQKLKNV